MESSSPHLPQGKEELLKTDNALIPMRRNTTESHILKPLSIGCLTGQFLALFTYWNGLLKAGVIESFGDPIRKKSLPDLKMTNKRQLRINVLRGATYTTASLGVFEMLTEKLRTKNNGRPLSLCEEAWCGLASGATAALVWYPVDSVYRGAAPHCFSYGRLFNTLCHSVRDKGGLTLWKGSGLYIARQMTANLGMLVSYNRSKKYVIESKYLSQWHAQMCAGIISGFFAAACSHPCNYVKAIKNIVQDQYHLGDKHSYRKIPRYIRQILTPYNGFKFYSGFPTAFGRWAPYCMAQWFIFEYIHTFEECMESSTGDSETNYLGKD